VKAWRTGGAALLAAAALHGAGWLYASQRVRSGAEAYLDSLRGEGWTITHMPVRLAGWPLAAAVQVPGFAADGSGAGVPVAWTATEVRIGVAATQPGTMRITPSGAQRWRVGAGPWTELTSDSFDLALDGRGAVLAVQGLNLSGTSIHVASARAEVAELDVSATVTGASAGMLPWPVEAATLEATLTQPPPASGPAAAVAWRDAGGLVQVRALTLSAGPVQASASGTARLDGQLQPGVDLTVLVRGHRPALDRLVQAGTIPEGTATAAKAVLGLLASRDPGAPAKVPVTLAGGVLAVAGFPLLRLPPLAWAAPPADQAR